MDFGTSNSTIGIWQNQSPLLAPLESDKTLLPSALFFDFEEDRIHFGRRAIEHYIDGVEGRLMQSLKSVLGSSLMGEKTQLKTRALSFEDILGHFIGHLKSAAERCADRPLEHIVIGRPVRFDDDSDEADRAAQDTLENIARAQGYQHIAFQYEPIAAAFDFEQQTASERLALIVDIGGGTSDFCVLRLNKARQQQLDRQGDVLANHGVHIGGTDFDRLLSLQHVMPLLGLGGEMRNSTGNHKLAIPAAIYHDLATWHTINLQYTKATLQSTQELWYFADDKAAIQRLLTVLEERLGHQIALALESGKIALSQQTETTVDLDLIERNLTTHILRQDLTRAIEGLVGKIVEGAQQTIQLAGVGTEQIDALFLTGGSTAIPSLHAAITQLAPNADIVDGDRFGSVGMGLTLDAARRFA